MSWTVTPVDREITPNSTESITDEPTVDTSPIINNSLSIMQRNSSNNSLSDIQQSSSNNPLPNMQSSSNNPLLNLQQSATNNLPSNIQQNLPNNSPFHSANNDSPASLLQTSNASIEQNINRDNQNREGFYNQANNYNQLCLPTNTDPINTPQIQTPRNTNSIQSYHSLASNATANQLGNNIQQNYMDIKTAAKTVPIFDGSNPGSLAKFIKACKVAEARVDPREHLNLTILIRAHVIGEADNLILNNEEPQTISDLINILKSTYMDVYDIQQIQSELAQIHQLEGETIRVYGARVSNMLTRAIEATKSAPELGTSANLFKGTALHRFVEGLRDQSLRKSIRALKFQNLKEAIETAQKDESSESIIEAQVQHIKIMNQAKVCLIESKAFRGRCHHCNEIGHKITKCPQLHPYSKPQCAHCQKIGHIIQKCWILNPDLKPNPFYSKQQRKTGAESNQANQQHNNVGNIQRASAQSQTLQQPNSLNSQNALRDSQPQSTIFVARANASA